MDDPFALDAEPPPSVRAEPTYIAGLNPPQRQAVETLDGPLLVLSGAGTGKTRVLTTRLVHILSTRRAWPSQTLTVTFTNKAAREMRTRVEALIGPSALEGLWLGTFHALGLRILRRHAELVGLQPSFSILDADSVANRQGRWKLRNGDKCARPKRTPPRRPEPAPLCCKQALGLQCHDHPPSVEDSAPVRSHLALDSAPPLMLIWRWTVLPLAKPPRSCYVLRTQFDRKHR